MLDGSDVHAHVASGQITSMEFWLYETSSGLWPVKLPLGYNQLSLTIYSRNLKQLTEL